MNKDLGKTKISETVRVSSAAIHYADTSWGIPYYQYETFIFSDNPNFKTRMFIWGTSSGKTMSDKLIGLTERAHRRISKVLLGCSPILEGRATNE